MKRAIVLGGGGARGAYQLGFWKALREYDITYDLVVGTSIGAINGAVMAIGDFDIAEKLWREINVDGIMRDGINLELSLQSLFRQRAKLIPFLKSYINFRGADTTPLRNLILQTVDEEKLRASSTDFGLVTLELPSLKPHKLLTHDIPSGKLDEFLMASSACFPAFPIEEIDGKYYIDGGYYDNLPIDFALSCGADEIIAVELSHDEPTHPEYQNRKNIICISPSEPLGNFLNFDRKLIDRNIELGYRDTMHKLKKRDSS